MVAFAGGRERGGKCPNADINPTEIVQLGGNVPPHVVPKVTVAAGSGNREYGLRYRDARPGRPWMVESPDPETGRVERGRMDEVRFRLVPMNVEEVPEIPPPRNLVRASDISNDVDPLGLSKEETVATLLNSHNVRHLVQKMKQEKGRKFVVMIEYDARMTEAPDSSKEATVCLTITLRSEGIGEPFPDSRKKIYLHADFTNVDPYSKESVVAGWVGSTMASSPWATVRGLLPLGIDFVLNHPYYSGMMARAKERGRTVEIRLYDCSPVFGLRGEANTSDAQMTRMVYFMQSSMREYGAMELCRLPDGYTGKEVDNNPKAVVDIMRRLEAEGKWVGQPLLVTDEERCIPQSTLIEEAFHVQVDDLKMNWNA